MSSIKDIRMRMANVTTTSQVINAMNMVSATKLNRARARLEGIIPMHREMTSVINDLKRFENIREHPLAMERKIKNSLYIVVTSDKGLCGSYNINICNAALKHMNAGKNERILAIGTKANHFFSTRDKNVTRRVTNATEAQIYTGAEQLAKIVKSLYESGEVDEVFIAFTEFKTTLSHIPRVERLLPLYSDSDMLDAEAGMIYEPEVLAFFEHTLPLYLHMCLFSMFSHSITCEHAARMVNMESAGNNATDIIDDLKLMYNRKRQTAITQELNEIVSSASTLN